MAEKITAEPVYGETRRTAHVFIRIGESAYTTEVMSAADAAEVARRINCAKAAMEIVEIAHRASLLAAFPSDEWAAAIESLHDARPQMEALLAAYRKGEA